MGETDKKYKKRLKTGGAEKTFAQGDEGGDVLNPIQIQVLQLQPIMLQ